MADIVFFCIPAHGHTNPTLGVVKELTARGHRVRYYSYSFLREKIEAAGAEFVSCDDFDREQHLDPKDAARLGKDLAFSTRILVDTTLALDERVCADMADFRPDCIVADSMAIWGKLAARKLGIPFVSSTTTFAFNQHAAKIMKQSPGQLLGMLFSLPKIGKEIARLQERGYPVRSVTDIIGNDPDTHTIVYTSPEFQPCAETFSEKYAFVGPSVRQPAEQIEKTREKLIYLSMGTVNNDQLPLYKRWISLLGGRKEQAILSVGDRIDISALGSLPDNVSVFSHVDQIAVLEKADVFISHCGMNSVSESLYYGVPLIMLPQTTEQQGVARRVEQLGAGILPGRTSRPALENALTRMLTDSSCRERAERIGAGFRSCPGAKGAADKIESML